MFGFTFIKKKVLDDMAVELSSARKKIDSLSRSILSVQAELNATRTELEDAQHWLHRKRDEKGRFIKD